MRNEEKRRCFQEFARYSIFSVFGMLGTSCYILADTFFVSAGMGTEGLAALNLAIPVYNFIHGCGLMCGMGGATQYSMFKSLNNRNETDKLFTNTCCLAGFFAVFFFFAGVFLPEKLALFLGAEGAVFQMSAVYLRWLLLFAPAFIMNDVFLCYVRNDNAPKLAMTAMLTGSFSNIILDYIFIFPMNMGIFGAIFATGLSPVISMAIMASHKIKRKNEFHFIKSRFIFYKNLRILSLGFPSLLGQISSGIVMITFNFLILRLEGNVGVAAYGVVANIALVVVAIYTGMAQGVQPLVSGSYGKGQYERMEWVVKYAVISSAVVSCLLYSVTFFGAAPIAGIFNSDNNALLQQIAVDGLRLYFISNLFVGYNIIISIYFTSAGQALPAHVLSLLRGLLLLVPMAFFLSYFFKMKGIWLAYPAAEAIVALGGWRVYNYYKKKFREKGEQNGKQISGDAPQ